MLEPLGQPRRRPAACSSSIEQAVEDQLLNASATRRRGRRAGSRLFGPLVMPTTMTFGLADGALKTGSEAGEAGKAGTAGTAMPGGRAGPRRSRAALPSSAPPAASAPRAASCDRRRAPPAARAKPIVGRRGGLKQPELPLRLAWRAADRRAGRRASARRARARRESRARDRSTAARQAGQPRHLDAVAAIRAARARSCAGR